MRKKILWICPKWIIPAQDGQRVASLNLLRQVAKSCDVSLLSFCLPEDKPDIEAVVEATGVQHAFPIPIPGRKLDLTWILFLLAGSLRLTKLPITLFRFTRPAPQAKAKEWLEKNGPWDCTVFDTVHSAGLFYHDTQFQFPSALGKIFIRAHNVEHELWEMTAKKKRLPLFNTQARLMRLYEQELLKKSDITFTVSLEDKQKLLSLLPNCNIEVLPIGMPFPPNAPRLVKEDTLLFLGKLDWPPNRDGLSWFLTHVWPTLQKEKSPLRLLIAGSGDSQWLERILPLESVEFLGRVDDISKVYAKSTAMIVPIFYGSGTRVKAVEAARYGLATISTSLGVQGLRLIDKENVQIAETKEEWIQTLRYFDAAKSIQQGQNAFYFMKSQFDEHSLAQILVSRI